MEDQTPSESIHQSLKQQLRQLRRIKGFVSGSLVKIYRKCGATNCHCAKGGEKHPAYLLTSKVRGKTKAVYVPVDKVEEVRQWTQEYRELKLSIKAISDLHEELIRLHVSQRRKAARTRKRK